MTSPDSLARPFPAGAFSLSPDPARVFRSRHHADALAGLVRGLEERQGLLVAVADVGMGKTTLAHAVLASLGAQARTAYVVYTCLPFDELLRHALDDFGVRCKGGGRAHLLRALADFVENCAASGQLVVLIIDEAQSLPDDTFEELHLLLDVGAESRGRLQIILLGQPELDERLRAPQLRPIAERVAVRVDLKPLDQAESRRYVAHRLAHSGGAIEMFSDPALELIVRRAHGVPRRVNILCHDALRLAYTAGSTVVTRKIARKAIYDLSDANLVLLQRHPPALDAAAARRRQTVRWSSAALAMLAVAGFVAVQWRPRVGPPPTARRLEAARTGPVTRPAPAPAPPPTAVPAVGESPLVPSVTAPSERPPRAPEETPDAPPPLLQATPGPLQPGQSQAEPIARATAPLAAPELPAVPAPSPPAPVVQAMAPRVEPLPEVRLPVPAPSVPAPPSAPAPPGPVPRPDARSQPIPRATPPAPALERPLRERTPPPAPFAHAALAPVALPAPRTLPPPPAGSAAAPAASEATPKPAASSPLVVARTSPARIEPLAPPSEVSDDEVRALLDRYVRAWHAQDVAELRRIGQVADDRQAQALARYFQAVHGLEVEVNVLDMGAGGDRRTVRFTRRDRFRDPTGRQVSTESPPIEKTIVRTPDGIRFAPRS